MGTSLIAANTKRIIADKGLKQRVVAAKAGFSEKQFSALMTGRRIKMCIRDRDIGQSRSANNHNHNQDEYMGSSDLLFLLHSVLSFSHM